MGANELASKLLHALTQHIPPGWEWTPLVGAAVAAAIGAVFLFKGARLAPVLAALAIAALGGCAGAILSARVALPLWPTVIVAATVGLVLGIVLFRIWFALLVAGSLTFACVSVYGGQVLLPALSDYSIRGLVTGENGAEVSLPEASAAATDQPSWQVELAQIWAYLGDNVAALHGSLLAIALSTGLAGLVFALLLPMAARSFWAATIGTGLFVPAMYGVLHELWPPGAAWLSERVMLVAALVWSVSLLANLADVLAWRPKKPAPKEAEAKAA